MIDRHHRCKNIGGVAVLADIGCLNMCRVLARCVRAVMTADAIAGDIDVIKVRWQPANGAVAVIAGIAAGDMRRVLADGSDAVVA